MKFNNLKEVMLWVDNLFIKKDKIFQFEYQAKKIFDVNNMKSEIAEDPNIMKSITIDIDMNRDTLDTEEKVIQYLKDTLSKNGYNIGNYNITSEKKKTNPTSSRGSAIAINVEQEEKSQFVYYNNIKSLITPYLKAIYYLSNVNSGLMSALQNVRKEVAKMGQLSKNQKLEINSLTTLNEKYKNQISDLEIFNNELEIEIDEVLSDFKEVKDKHKISIFDFNELIKVKDDYIFALLDNLNVNIKVINQQDDSIKILKDNLNLEYIKYQDYIKEHQNKYFQIKEDSKNIHLANEVLRERNNGLMEQIKSQKFIIESHEATITKLLEKLEVRSEVYLEKIENGILRDIKELRKKYNKNLSELNRVKERLELKKYGKFE